VASGWSRSSTEGHRGEGRAAEEGRKGSPSSQASAWSRQATGIEEEGGMMAKAEEPWTQLATRIPKELHRRLKLHCVTHDIVLMHFVVEAIEEKLGRRGGSKKKVP
jgi:hypothetical protein